MMMADDFIVGVDLGGTRIKMGIVQNGILVNRKTIAARSSNGLQGYLPELKEHINDLIATTGLSMESLAGIGLAFPCIVDPYKKRILQTNNKYPDACELDMASWVAKEWNVPLVLDNDANMAAVGEGAAGAAKDCSDFVTMTIGTGIGSAAIMNGQLLRGKHFQAGCLGGHFVLNYKGATCGCGNIGCAEVYASSWCLKDKILHTEGFASSLLNKGQPLDYEQLFIAVRQQDAVAITIAEDCMDAWAATIINLVHAYDPEKFVLGGGVMRSADIILPYVTSKVQKHVWSNWGTVEIVTARLGDDAAIIGIASLLQH